MQLLLRHHFWSCFPFHGIIYSSTDLSTEPACIIRMTYPPLLFCRRDHSFHAKNGFGFIPSLFLPVEPWISLLHIAWRIPTCCGRTSRKSPTFLSPIKECWFKWPLRQAFGWLWDWYFPTFFATTPVSFEKPHSMIDFINTMWSGKAHWAMNNLWWFLTLFAGIWIILFFWQNLNPLAKRFSYWVWFI